MSIRSTPVLSAPLAGPSWSAESSLAGSKWALAILLAAWVTVPYFLLQRWPFRPIHCMSPGPIDRAVPFQESMIWPYLSLYLLLPLAPLGLTTPRQVRRFATDLAVIILISHLLFALWPTRVARPVEGGSDPAYRLVIAADNSLNACPSLHASLAVYSALWCHHLLHGRRARLLRPALWAWTFAILYATLAVRQHVVTDLLAGTALALGTCAANAWWDSKTTSPRIGGQRHATAR